MTKEKITRNVEVCDQCHTAYYPNDGEVCMCPEPTEAQKQAEWHEKLTEGDCY